MFKDPIISRIAVVILSLVMIVIVGTVGYTVIEGWSWSDGFFMTAITASTVGYGETHELSRQGRSFTAGLIAVSVIAMTCWNAALTSFLVDGDISGRYFRRKNLRMIAGMRNHTVVCGTTKVAQAVVDRLVRRQVEIVVIGENKSALEEIRKVSDRIATLEGMPTSELVLANANIMSASAVVAVLESEVDNLLVGITCKDLGTNVSVLARAETAAVGNRMRKAGIDEVICPPEICGDRVSEVLLGLAGVE